MSRRAQNIVTAMTAGLVAVVAVATVVLVANGDSGGETVAGAPTSTTAAVPSQLVGAPDAPDSLAVTGSTLVDTESAPSLLASEADTVVRTEGSDSADTTADVPASTNSIDSSSGTDSSSSTDSTDSTDGTSSTEGTDSSSSTNTSAEVTVPTIVQDFSPSKGQNTPTTKRSNRGQDKKNSTTTTQRSTSATTRGPGGSPAPTASPTTATTRPTTPTTQATTTTRATTRPTTATTRATTTTTRETTTTTRATTTTTRATTTTTRATTTTTRATTTTTRATTTTTRPTTTTTRPTTTTTRPTTTTTRPSGGNGNRSTLYGYLWGDGNYNGDNKFFFRTSSSRIADNFRASTVGNTSDVREGSNGSFITFNVTVPGVTGWSNGVPSNLGDPEAFSAAVIEGEGSRSGLVLDDPSAGRRTGFANLLNSLGVDTSISGRNVYADQASWPVFDDWPFVACGRVPGGGNC